MASAVVDTAGFAAAPRIFRAVACAATEGGWTAASTSIFAATGGGTTTAVLASAVPAADGRVGCGSQHGPGCGFCGDSGREDCGLGFDCFDVGRRDGC